jgi:orotate phosphoribosyltransferase
MFAERHEGALTLRRGFSLTDSDRVLVVEDVVTTGGSIRETIEVARATGATVIGAGAVVDRSGGVAELGVPFHPLATVAFATHDFADCPLCAEGEPVTKPGSRQVNQ